MSVKPFPVLALLLEGGPDDGQTRLMPVTTSVVPPERLEASVDAPGCCVRQPELEAAWTWRYRWEPAPVPV